MTWIAKLSVLCVIRRVQGFVSPKQNDRGAYMKENFFSNTIKTMLRPYYTLQAKSSYLNLDGLLVLLGGGLAGLGNVAKLLVVGLGLNTMVPMGFIDKTE